MLQDLHPDVLQTATYIPLSIYYRHSLVSRMTRKGQEGKQTKDNCRNRRNKTIMHSVLGTCVGKAAVFCSQLSCSGWIADHVAVHAHLSSSGVLGLEVVPRSHQSQVRQDVCRAAEGVQHSELVGHWRHVHGHIHDLGGAVLPQGQHLMGLTLLWPPSMSCGLSCVHLHHLSSAFLPRDADLRWSASVEAYCSTVAGLGL